MRQGAVFRTAIGLDHQFEPLRVGLGPALLKADAGVSRDALRLRQESAGDEQEKA